MLNLCKNMDYLSQMRRMRLAALPLVCSMLVLTVSYDFTVRFWLTVSYEFSRMVHVTCLSKRAIPTGW